MFDDNVSFNHHNNFLSLSSSLSRDLQGNNITIIYETDFINLSKVRIL